MTVTNEVLEGKLNEVLLEELDLLTQRIEVGDSLSDSELQRLVDLKKVIDDKQTKEAEAIKVYLEKQKVENNLWIDIAKVVVPAVTGILALTLTMTHNKDDILNQQEFTLASRMLGK